MALRKGVDKIQSHNRKNSNLKEREHVKRIKTRFKSAGDFADTDQHRSSQCDGRAN